MIHRDKNEFVQKIQNLGEYCILRTGIFSLSTPYHQSN